MRGTADLELGFTVGFKTWPSYQGAGVPEGRAPGSCLTEGELVCPCVKEEKTALAPPLLQAAGNDPEQGTKGTMQGWVCSQCECTHGILKAPGGLHGGKAVPCNPEIAVVHGAAILKIEPA